MQFEPELVKRLIQAKCLSQVADPKGFALELATDKGAYMARINKEQVIDLYKRSKAGDVEAMYVVSALYDLGIGVPEDHRAASDWANFSTLQGGNVSFKEATRKLKTDIANSIDAINDGYVYPETYMKAIARFKSFLSFGVYGKVDCAKDASIRVAPFLSGVQVATCYKKVKGKEEWALYDMWMLEENRMLPMFSHFASRILPLRLSEWLNGDRITHSNTVGISGNFVFVYGTLAVRKDRVQNLREHLPGVNSARELLDAYLANANSSEPSFDEAELQPLRNVYNKAARHYKTTGSNKAAYREAKREYRTARDTLRDQKANWIAKQPQTYLDFVAYDMVGYSKGQIIYLTDIATRYVKLQSTAFIPPTTRGYGTAGLPAITNIADFKKHHKQVYEHLKSTCPYKLVGLEVLQLEANRMNAGSRIVYKVKE